VIKVLVSSCLLGEPVRYHGGDARLASGILDRWRAEGRLVPTCPEAAGGLPVPRPPAEMVGGDGRSVLKGEAHVRDRTGADVTQAFAQGARSALEAGVVGGARLAILKDGSPSCGTTFVYDGTFRGQRSQGLGVTAALLEQAGIRVFNERQIEEAAAFLASLESEER
jgi:uncharacterized protein YbbK (DUF523 family)